MAAATPVTGTAPVSLEKKPVKFSNLLRESLLGKPPAVIVTDRLQI